MKKILIVEDNERTLLRLKKIVFGIDGENEIFAFNNVNAAYRCASTTTIDLFIIDIILDTSEPGDASGLNFVEWLRQVDKYAFTPVIFVTGLEDPRIYTYEKLHCYRFIEKPFDEKQVEETVQKCLEFPGKAPEKKSLYFRSDGIVWHVSLDDIVYAESEGRSMHIHAVKDDTMTIPYKTVKQLLDEVDSPNFLQCNRGTVVNTDYIRNIDLTNSIIELKNDLGRLEIGVTFKNRIKKFLSE